MPTPSNSSPRRDSSGNSPRVARAAKTGTASKLDVGSKRRALKKKRARQGNWAAWTAAAAITLILAGAGAGIWAELHTTRERVAQKQAILSDLKVQLERGQHRLRALSSASGKERVLVENGFIRPGERLLLFPQTAKK